MINENNKIKEKGSISIEASISLVFFTFCMITLLTIINISRAQAAIGNAINLTALEMSQYMYFYDVSGLYSFDTEMKEIASSAKDKSDAMISSADQTIAGVETMLEMINKSGEDLENIGDSHESIAITYSNLRDSYDKINETGTSITESLDTLNGQIQQYVLESPMDFVKGLVAMGVSAGMDLAKSHVIASPLAKAMCVKHIGNGRYSDNTKVDADLYLKALGVVDGLEGLNFNLSTLFAADSPKDINIVVVYKARPFPVLQGLEVTFAQSASTQGWLGGDEMKAPQPQTSKEPEVVTEDTPIWSISSNIERGKRFKEILKETYAQADIVSDTSQFYGYHADTNTYYSCVSINTFMSSYNTEKGFNATNAANTAQTSINKTLNYVQDIKEVKVGDTTYPVDPSRQKNVECLVIIPEDASSEVVAALQAKLDAKAKKYNESNSGVQISYRIVKAGGNASDKK